MSIASRRYAAVEAPSVLGLRPTGVEKLPERLRELGLLQRIDARHAGRIEAPPYSMQRDAETLTLNARAIADWTPLLADRIQSVVEDGDFPIVLGGDCSILLGAMLALRRRGRSGLLFIDGHADFYQPQANPNGEAASMDLALATGHGPPLLTDIEQRRPLVRPADTVLFGFRDAQEQRHYGSQPLPPELRAFDLETVRRLGIAQAARAAVEPLLRDELSGFFIHVDADCLDDAIMPAVDYRLPDGLSAHELQTALSVALASGKAVGLEVTIYNPNLDRDGSAGTVLVNALANALGSAPPGGHSW